MITRVSSDAVDELLTALEGLCTHLGVLESPPASFTAASESRAGDYRRAPVVWRRSGSGLLVQSQPCEFAGLASPSSVVALALFNGISGGAMHAWGMLPEPIIVAENGKIVVKEGTVSLRIA